MGDPPNGWFIIENPKIKIDDLGVPPFQETSKSVNHPIDGMITSLGKQLL